MLVTFSLVVARSMVPVVLVFFLPFGLICRVRGSYALCSNYVLVERLFAFSFSRQTGVATLLVRSVARSSAVRLTVAKSCHCETQCLCRN